MTIKENDYSEEKGAQRSVCSFLLWWVCCNLYSAFMLLSKVGLITVMSFLLYTGLP